MAKLKRLPKELTKAALEKALRYRLLNEPLQAESICRDVLAVEPDNQEALVTLILALTDQFDTEFATAWDEAKKALEQLQGNYEQAYYDGIIHERWGRAQLARNIPPSYASQWYLRAMQCFEEAEKLSQPGNPDAILRWNTCARYLDKQPLSEQETVSMSHDIEEHFGGDVPLP
jgi:hypothetical protein